MRSLPIAPLLVMSMFLTTPSRAIYAAGVEGPAAMAPQQQPVAVSVEPPMSLDVVLYAAGAAGKVLATTDRSGKGAFDAGSLQNLGTLDVIEETCGEQKRVLLVAPMNQPPPARNCERRSVNKFVGGTNTALSIKLSGSAFAKLNRPPTIPDPPAEPARAAVAAPAAGGGQAQPARAQAGAGQACPPGAAMVGTKLDLPPGGNQLESATLLVPCVYRGLSDTADDKWTYYKIDVPQAQTLKVVFRLRDSNFPAPSKFDRFLYGATIRLHGPNGGKVVEGSANEPSIVRELEYKASESGFAFIGLHHAVRDAAIQFSISPTKP